MTMEERSGGIDDGAPMISTGAPINSSSPNKPSAKTCAEMTSASYPLQRTNKRSFDVAFLVAPDEKLLRRQSEKLGLNLQYCTSRLMSDAMRVREQEAKSLPIGRDLDYGGNTDDDSRDYEANDRAPQNLTIKHFESIEARHKQQTMPPYPSPKRRLTPVSPEPPVAHPYASATAMLGQGAQKSPSPPAGMFQRGLQARKLFAANAVDECSRDGLGLAKTSCDGISCPDSRSAFTKVSLAAQRSSLIGCYDDVGSVATSSPRSSISPDAIAYHNSLSPPIGALQAPNSTGKYAPANSFPAKMPPYPFVASSPEATSPRPQTQSPPNNNKMPSNSSGGKNNNPAKSGFRPELPAAVYPSLPYSHPLSAVFPPIGDALARPRLLAAASLLPSSLAALALPAQNVCAKCNLSFRMTSDLVYHMRSHHKSEHAGEAARRRREEKLRCPVCDESFRERHHLTRHMTAHQDKESDAVVDQVEIKRRNAATAAAAAAAAAATLVQSGK